LDNLGISKLIDIKTEFKQENFSGLNKKTGKNDDAELKKACKDFESVMIHQMLKAMRKTVPEGGILEKSNASDVWESLYDEKISFEVSGEQKGTGLAKFLYEELGKGSNLNLKS